MGKPAKMADVLKKMDQEGYKPASASELLAFFSEGWNGIDWVIALGTTWVNPRFKIKISDGVLRDIPPNVLMLRGYTYSGKDLGYTWVTDEWGKGISFLGVYNKTI